MRILKRVIGVLLAAVLLLAGGCATNPSGMPNKNTLPAGDQTPGPELDGTASPMSLDKDMPVNKQIQLPKKLQMGDDGMPTLTVYVKSKSELQEMPLEKYLEGVLAGEMKNDWPLEALKAQAILARTFVLKFLEEKESKYPGADVSTDIEEAQAYDVAGVNDRIKEAVSSTKGMVLVADGQFPFAWFHAHSGGITAMAKEGLEYEKAEPSYIHSVPGMENDSAPADVAKWSESFPAAEVMKAAAKMGAKGERVTSIQIGQRGPSGRATTLIVNGSSIPAASFRIALGSTKMKSTLLDALELADTKVTIAGRGYGHGVGMSQWGAYALAQQGEDAQRIVEYYFNGVSVERMW